VTFLLGDPSKAKERFGWTPEVPFEGLVKMMVRSDVELYEQLKNLKTL